jgi:ATP adenylyltransferase
MPGGLWPRARATAERALASGALQPIATGVEVVAADGVRFVVRVVSGVAKKERATGKGEGGSRNPFLPPEEALRVADLSESHLCLLNKFPVTEGHLLIVTRDFEEQDAPLTAADFDALWRGLGEAEALGFYNAGKDAGASQRHKHLQLVPLPLGPVEPPVPIEPLLEPARFDGPLGSSPALPFDHRLARCQPGWSRTSASASAGSFELYAAMLGELGLGDASAPDSRTEPYNLLVTRRWMLLIPRRRERVDGISINALGYAGGFLVRDRERAEALRRRGPLALLREGARFR